MGKIIDVKLGEFRRTYKYDLANVLHCKQGDIVILNQNGTSEFGEIVSDVENACVGKRENAKGKILRKATDGDLKQIENNKRKAREAMQTCTRKISDYKLDMRLVKSEFVFDCSKVIFYFTADGRVDFRNLVKELARTFHVRIELKQIGVRDKAQIVGGYGVCGRELCCSSFMSDFSSLSIKMAKAQGLPLNPSRISGMCGRIKCCMAYEFEAYKELSKSLPKIGSKFKVDGSEGRVVGLDILKGVVNVDTGQGAWVRKPIERKPFPIEKNEKLLAKTKAKK